MPFSPVRPGSVRSAAEINQQIRALWPHPAVRLTDVERARLEELYAEWAAAVRAEIVKAA